MKYLKRVKSKDDLRNPELRNPSVYFYSGATLAEHVVKYWAKTKEAKMINAYIDAVSTELNENATFKSQNYETIYDIMDFSKNVSTSYPVENGKYATTTILVEINNNDLPLSDNYTFAEQGYDNIYKIGEMHTNQKSSAPIKSGDGIKYFTNTYEIYVDGSEDENIYHVVNGYSAVDLGLSGLGLTYFYDPYKKLWNKIEDISSYNFDATNLERMYVGKNGAFITCVVDGQEVNLANCYILKYQGYSKDEGSIIYYLGNYEAEEGVCNQKPKDSGTTQYVTENSLITCRVDGTSTKMSSAYTLSAQSAYTSILKVYNSDHKEWLDAAATDMPVNNAMYSNGLVECTIDDVKVTKYSQYYTWEEQGVTKMYNSGYQIIDIAKEHPVAKETYFTSETANS